MAAWLMVIPTRLMAVGTFVLAAIAIWGGDQIRNWLFPPKLALRHLDGPPDPVTVEPPRYYEHLRLCNSGRTIARNCRVLLRAIQRKQPNGEFLPQHVWIPLQFTWSPSEMPPLWRDVMKNEETLDFGFIAGRQTTKFEPQFYVTPVGHDYSVPAGGTVRYFVEIVADGHVCPKRQVFEVAWDGTWDDDPTKMRDHLHVIDVTEKAVVYSAGRPA